MAGSLLPGYGRDRIVVATGSNDMDLPHRPAVSSNLSGHDLLDQVERDDTRVSLVGR